MRYLILLLAFAAVCAAQTSPVIVKTATFENQSQVVGSLQSPETLYTAPAAGFYRMTMFISDPSDKVGACGVYAPATTTTCGLSDSGDVSVVVSFAVKAGQPIGYYTTNAASLGSPLVGTYDLFIAIEKLY